ncbi:MAG TPA: purine-nucleoside phosphorylase [Polyangiaceae bacterium]|nr:purine-nucleoside phosphorylase [Polyangiaceae bacterium]
MTADIERARDGLLSRLGEPAELGVVLGSGLGGFAESLSQAVRIPYRDIEGFPQTSVAGHGGALVAGTLGSVRVLCLSGRVHLYEGHPPSRVVFGARLLAALGCRAVILTNAAGATRADWSPGSLVLLSDHLNLTGQNPLVGAAESPFARFPDMTEVYDVELRALAHDAARDGSIELLDGIYAGVLGPSYETPAEIRMLRTLGADLVGMSTVHEAIALRHRGVRVGALSVVTNLAAGLAERPLDHAEVEAVGAQAREKLETLLDGWLARSAAALRLRP